MEKDGTLISVVTTSKKYLKLDKYLGHDGFTIIEILMAISLVAVVFIIIPFAIIETDRQKIEGALEKLQRAITSGTDEAILKNSIVRLKVEYNEQQLEYSLEYGQGANLVLPQIKDLSRLSLKEREAEIEKQEKLDSKFNKTREFLNSNEKLPEIIQIFAQGTAYQEDILLEPPFYIYFYPTGEKDDSILMFYTPEEIATFTVHAFEDRTDIEYIPFTESDIANLDSALENKTKEIFENWLKND